jgi:hypothetical protein
MSERSSGWDLEFDEPIELTLITLFLLLRHFPCAAMGGIGNPFFTTSRSRLVLKYTSMSLPP